MTLAAPDSRFLVWCHEDTPFLWPEIQREITDVDPTVPMDGELDMIETIMRQEGYERLEAFLSERDVTSPIKRQRIVATFLETHAIAEEIEAEIDLPGWTDDTVDDLTDLYEDDVEEIAGLPGVTLLTP